MNNSSIFTNSSEESQHLVNTKNLFLTPVLLIIILTTILGNLLVVISGVIEKSLRTPSNCLIFSLAISDLIVGLIVMPLRSSVAIYGYWPFRFRCDLPFELNVMSSQASVLHLVAIAIDRYIIVSKIQRTSLLFNTRSKVRIAIMIAIAWTIPVLFVSAPFLGWRDTEWEVRNKELKCIGNRDLSYRVVGVIITFYIPVTIIIIFYVLIYRIARKSGGLKRNLNKQTFQLNDRHSAVECECESQAGNQTVCGQLWKPNIAVCGQLCKPNIAVCGQLCKQNIAILKTHSNSEERERRVIKTLMIITSVFLLCWSPFFISYLFYIKQESIPYLFQETVIWFGLCNSAMNPIIYAYFVPTFRSAFKKVLLRK